MTRRMSAASRATDSALLPSPDPRTPRLVYCPHPLLAADRRIVHEPFHPGESIAGYFARIELQLGDCPVALHLNDRPIARSEWALTFPQAGDMMVLRVLLQGGGDGGSNPLRVILTIALIVFAPAMAGMLGFGAGGVGMLQFGTSLVLVGGSLLINAVAPLSPARRPDGRGLSDASSPTYALAGGSNRARPFEPMPLVFGLHRIYPDLGARFYTEFAGEDQILYGVFHFGLSDVVLSEFRIGDTLLTDFTGVETQESDATGALTLFPANVDTVAGGALTAAAGWITRTSSLNATALAIDITGYLMYAGDDGLRTRSADIEMEYKAVASGTWLPFLDSPSYNTWAWGANAYVGRDNEGIPTAFNGHKYRRVGSGYTGGTEPIWPTAAGAFVADGPPVCDSHGFTYPYCDGPDYGAGGASTQPGWVEAGAISAANVVLANGSRAPLRRGYRRNVASGQYDVRVRRVTPDETDLRATSDIVFATLRTYQPDTADYTGQNRVALKIRASGQLQGAIEQLSALASARVPVWNGSSWVTQATSNPAWLFLWFARGKTIAGRRVFGAGLADARIEIEGIKAWGAWCATKGLTCNFVHDRAANCAEVLQIVARAGRAAPTWATGKLGVVWDEANQPAVAVFGMSNIQRNTFQIEYITGPLADEIVLNFINPDLNWQPDTVRVTVPGVTNPVRPAMVELLGCTDKVMAGKEANLLAAEQVYRRRRISWESDFEGMVVQRGDVAVLAHDLTQWGYSGRLVSGTVTVLHLDRKVPFTPSASHYLGLRLPDGTYAIHDVVYQAGESDTITLAVALPAAPDADPDHPPLDYLWFFEPQATPGKLVKIINVQPLDERHVRLTATDEEPAYYASESNPYTYVPPATYGSQVPAISGLEIGDNLIRLGQAYATTITLAWNVTGAYGGAIIRVAANGQPRGDIGRTRERRFEFQGPAAGALDIEVQLFGPQGELGAAGRAFQTYVIVGKDRYPANVTGFSCSQNGRFVVFRWNEIADVDREGYEIRRNPQGVTDWNRGMFVTQAEQGTQMTSGTVPPGAWTMLIKARDTSGNYSYTAASFDIDVTNALDIVFQKQQAPDWLGTKTNFLVHWTGKLVPESTKAANLHTRAELFEQFVPYPQASCAYEAPEIDLGFDSDVRVWADLQGALGRGRLGVVDPQLLIDYRTAAGAYDGFEPWGIGDVRARYVKEKFTLDTASGVACMTGMQATADSEEFTQSGELVSAIGGVPIVFPQVYHIVADFQVTPSGPTAAYATYENLSGTGALARVWNSSGAEIAGRSARWSALGV